MGDRKMLQLHAQALQVPLHRDGVTQIGTLLDRAQQAPRAVELPAELVGLGVGGELLLGKRGAKTRTTGLRARQLTLAHSEHGRVGRGH